MNFRSRLPALLGIRYPIVQGGMSWASSCAALPLAVSRAGGLGVIAAGPMRPDALVAAIREVRAGTDAPFAVNVPLYNKRSAEFLDIAEAERVPVLIASQGGPKALPRFRAIGTKWLHVVASPCARCEGGSGRRGCADRGGRRGRRAIPRRTRSRPWCWCARWCAPSRIPVIGAGGVADGAGIAAMFALGAEGAQLGTRFLMTEEATVHPAYKARVLAAGIADTTLVGRGGLPIRQLRNRFSAEVDAAERSGVAQDTLAALIASPLAEGGRAGWRRGVRQGRGRPERRPGGRHPARGRGHAPPGRGGRGRAAEARRMKPLNGITILDLSRVLACPFASMILAELGAEVIKVEQPGSGDETRASSPSRPDPTARSAATTWPATARSASITVNLRARSGRARSSARSPRSRMCWWRISRSAR